MITLKCSRWTMLPTACASRSYCFAFMSPGAFMPLVYSPDALREIGVVRGYLLRHLAAQRPEVAVGGGRGLLHFTRQVVVEAGAVADVLDAGTRVEALQPEAPAGLLPGEK